MEAHEKENIVLLILGYLTGKASEADVLKLKEWINITPENHNYYLQVKNIWEISGDELKINDHSNEKALKNIMKRIEGEKQSVGFGYTWQRIAAVLFIPLIAGSFLWGRMSFKNNYTNNVVYNEVFAATGTRSSLKLSDGSVVWLNAGSSIRYPDRFLNNKRIVYLKGEAYFEVHSDIAKPFIVQTKSISVRATGTKFCVEAFANDKVTSVTLVSGKVFVEHTTIGKSQLLAEMLPNQHLDYDSISGKTDVLAGDAYKYVAWKDGKLIFRNESLAVVVKKISQLYDVDIQIKGNKMQDYRYHATFQEESLSEILKLLKISSPINYKEEKRTMLADGSFSKRKVIIYPINH